MTKSVSPDVLIETVEAFEANGRNQVKTAEALGIARSTLQNRLFLAGREGLGGDTLGVPLLPGFGIARVSTHVSKDGERTGWVIQDPNKLDHEATVQALQDAFKHLEGRSPSVLLPPSPQTNEDLLTVYNLADLHLGLYAWKNETGADYDLYIAEKLAREAVGQLVSQAPTSATGVVLNLGDFFHSDSNENRTRRSGNVLDVDTRFAKVLQMGVELMAELVQLALTKHETVVLRNIPGNHDPYGTLALTVAMAAWFRNDPRVVVDTSPEPYWFYRHGKVLLGAAHGDMFPPGQAPMVMAGMRPKDWGESLYRYFYLGHLHSKRGGDGEAGGARWEVFPTLAAKDAWAHQSGYVSNRGIISITHHKDRGEVTRQTVSVSPV